MFQSKNSVLFKLASLFLLILIVGLLWENKSISDRQKGEFASGNKITYLSGFEDPIACPLSDERCRSFKIEETGGEKKVFFAGRGKANLLAPIEGEITYTQTGIPADTGMALYPSLVIENVDTRVRLVFSGQAKKGLSWVKAGQPIGTIDDLVVEKSKELSLIMVVKIRE